MENLKGEERTGGLLVSPGPFFSEGDFSEIPLLVEVERAFSLLNERLFNSHLIIPLFRLNLRKKAKVRFHNQGTFEVVIGYGLARGTPEDFLSDLLHEMIHIQNWLNRVKDCTSNQYHNQNFKIMALNIGLYVARHRTQGWSVTSFGASSRIQETPDRQEIQVREEAIKALQFDESMFRRVQHLVLDLLANNDQKQFQYKYVCGCPPPHNSVRCGRRPDGVRPLEARCLKCDTIFALN